MKKQLLALAILTAGFAKSQVWTENFNSAIPPALPAGWLQNNVDAATTSTNATIASFSFGVNAGVTRNITAAYAYPASYSISLITTSAYQVAGTSDDWVISPSFTVPPNAVFNWEARSAGGPTTLNSYEIRVSTTGTTVANFNANPILFTVAENYVLGALYARGVSLNTYSNQTIRLAVHEISNNKWNAYYDNFQVMVPTLATDGGIVNITGLTRYMTGAGNQNITGTFKQLGYANATTAVLNYKVNAGAVVTQTMNFAPSVPYFGTAVYNFATPANLGLGTNNVKVWVSSVNGTPEANFANDTAYALVYLASVAKPMNALIEEFTSSTCPPCVALNATFDPLLNGNTPNTGGRVNVVKNQVNWPAPGNDPSYNADVAARVTYYAVGGVPTAFAGGKTTMVSHTQGEIDAAKALPAYADINASLIVAGNVVTANSTITPYLTIPSATPLRLYQSLVQKYYNYPQAALAQKDFYHAMRKMYPSSAGTVFTPADGVAQTANFTHNSVLTSIAGATPPQNTNDIWIATNLTYEYVVWVEDIISHDVIQSGSATGTGPNSVVEYKGNNSIGVYPNPAKDYAVVGIKLNHPSVVDINIFDVTGKLVYSNKGSKLEANENEIKINTSEFATGTYNVMVTTEQGSLKDKLIIVK